VPRKRPQVLGIGLNVLNRAAGQTASVCRASQRHPFLLERAADPLYGAGVNTKLFGNDADTGPSRSRQSLTDLCKTRRRVEVAFLCRAQGQNGCDLFRGVIVTWSERSGFGLHFRLMFSEPVQSCRPLSTTRRVRNPPCQLRFLSRLGGLPMGPILMDVSFAGSAASLMPRCGCPSAHHKAGRWKRRLRPTDA
jgi:hypothetical protein